MTEVAKVFTGWTIDKPNEGGGFKFEPRMHEPGPKFVLGHRIKPKGEDEGLELLHRLATSPQTARFISLKLAERFVSDDPPPALVDQHGEDFPEKERRHSRSVAVLFQSSEFWDDGTYRVKVKTPLEFVASAVRATGAEVDDALPLVRQLSNMGMPLYGTQPPTGYSMKAETWVSSSALLNRMNFALALSGGKIKGVQVDVAQFAGSAPPQLATRLYPAQHWSLACLPETYRNRRMTRLQHRSMPRCGSQRYAAQAVGCNTAHGGEHDRGPAIGLARISEEIAF